ncbi:nonstructural protein C [Cedar virus]|uniref:Nonstructural protein C n=1 Tax=Cedar virus TaxID=1221391 RepID=J7H4I1_9MONO|nr:nonstructural protein C [Cedar virus]AFP87276.1 nonstructural protein C [Cedar virus]AJP33317.1 nonstructural protein C [Cedar virus]
MASLLSILYRKIRKNYSILTEDPPSESHPQVSGLKSGRNLFERSLLDLNKFKGEDLRLRSQAIMEIEAILPILIREAESQDNSKKGIKNGGHKIQNYNWTQWLYTISSMTREGRIPTMENMTAALKNGIISEKEHDRISTIISLLMNYCPAYNHLLRTMSSRMKVHQCQICMLQEIN